MNATPLHRRLATRAALTLLTTCVVAAIGLPHAAAQETDGSPPTGEGGRALPLQGELWPAIPAEFNRPVRDYHVVQGGDTLFGISSAYFGSAYVWPIVWSFNYHITNPHWIYPGDVVYLRAPLPGDAPNGEGGPTPFPNRPEGTSIALAGFYSTDKEMKSVGTITASPEAKRLLAFPDRIYLDVTDEEERDRMQKGAVYAILRPIGQVKDPKDDDKVVGTKYLTLGAVRVVEKADQPKDDKEKRTFDTGVIVQSWEEIERGDLIYPYNRQLLQVAPAVATETVVGSIVDTLHVNSLFGEHFYVFIDKGSEDGVRVGNRFFAYDRNDGASGLDDDDADSRLPYERLGQLTVIHTDKAYSTALITGSKRELKLGMLLEMYKGY